ncbi:glycosyltransferase family 4 protein [Flavobacteriaceae sp. LMIT009]
MKVAYLTPEYPHHKTNKSAGIGTSIYNLARGLVALGHQVSVLVYGQDKDENFEDEGVHIYKVKNVKIRGLSLYLTQKKVERFINRLYNKGEIAIVEAPDWTGFTAFVKPKCPLVIKLHGSDTYFCHLDNRKVKPINRFLEKKALKKADAIISVSDFTGRLTNKLFKLSRDYKVIQNSIDFHSFVPIKKDSKLTILYFGTLIRKKGLLELPYIFNKVVAQVPGAKLVLVGKDASDIMTGSGSTWSLMEPLFSKEARQRVAYQGVVPYHEIREIIGKASLCVFPSFAEAFPVSWLEAMAMEKPIVASNVGWAEEMIENGKEGYLVDPKNYEDYANKIVKIIKDKEFQIELGRAAREKIKNEFAIDVVAQKSVEFYTQILN